MRTDVAQTDARKDDCEWRLLSLMKLEKNHAHLHRSVIKKTYQPPHSQPGALTAPAILL